MNRSRSALREATRACHERVDLAFQRFDLSDQASYTTFLCAHATVLPAAEAVVMKVDLWAEWVSRTPALLEDLQDLGASPPAGATAFAEIGTQAQAWGVLYVLEGSRLGGALLAERVRAGLPRRYLNSRSPGSWQAFQVALAAANDEGGDHWLTQAIFGAQLTFNAFEGAAK